MSIAEKQPTTRLTKPAGIVIQPVGPIPPMWPGAGGGYWLTVTVPMLFFQPKKKTRESPSQ